MNAILILIYIIIALLLTIAGMIITIVRAFIAKKRQPSKVLSVLPAIFFTISVAGFLPFSVGFFINAVKMISQII